MSIAPTTRFVPIWPLATGDVAGAKKQYEALTNDPSGPDARSSIRRIAKVSQARAFIDRKDLEAAERALGQVGSAMRRSKSSRPIGPSPVSASIEDENLPDAAYLWAKRLLPVITDDGRSELLFQLTDLAFAQNDNDLAKKCLAELLKKHAYSSEAAQAKEKWPAKLSFSLRGKRFPNSNSNCSLSSGLHPYACAPASLNPLLWRILPTRIRRQRERLVRALGQAARCSAQAHFGW